MNVSIIEGYLAEARQVECRVSVIREIKKFLVSWFKEGCPASIREEGKHITLFSEWINEKSVKLCLFWQTKQKGMSKFEHGPWFVMIRTIEKK